MKRVSIIIVAVLAIGLLAFLLIRNGTPGETQIAQGGDSCAAPGISESGLPADTEADIHAAVLHRINEHRMDMDMSPVEIMPPDVST